MPASLDELLTSLQNPNFKSYVVLGEETDDAWKMALAAKNFLAGVNCYLVRPALQTEVQGRFEVAPGHVGIVFGHGEAVARTLDKNQAADFQTITNAIKEAT